MVNKARVHGKLVFVSSTYQCLYVGKWDWEQPKWLKDNPDKWRYLEDVLREEATSPPPPAESKIALGTEPAVPNDQTSTHVTQDNGNNEDDVARVDTLVGDRSPSDEPTLLPTPVTATVESETKTPKLLRSADATAGEVEGPKSETAPLGKGRKRGRSGGRPTKRQEQISKARQKRLAERMRLMLIVLDSLRECPILSIAASKAGINRKTLEYWIKHSAAGDAGYDLEWEGIEWRFHEHCQTAIEEAHGKLDATAWDMTKEGVVYKTDQSLLDLGYEGRDAYLRDENGDPVPETVRHTNFKAVRFILERLRPDKYGKHQKIDVPRQGGVLVVGGIPHDIPKKVNKGTAASVKARQWKAGWRMVQKEKNNTDG